MSSTPSRIRRAAFFAVLALACTTAIAVPAGTLNAALADPKDAPAFVSACAIDDDSSGVFTPSITVTDRKPSAITEADVEIDFFDATNHLLGGIVVAPPYGPQGLPFGSVDHAACKVRSARFVDGSTYAPKVAGSGSSLLPTAGVLLGAGAAVLLLTNHGSHATGGTVSASAAPSAAASGGGSTATATPAPVGTIEQLARPKTTAVPKPH